MRDLFKTKALPLAAYLVLRCDKIRFQGIEPADQRSFFFVFTPLTKAEQLANDYFTGRAKVTAQAYANAQRSLKDLVFQRERQQASVA